MLESFPTGACGVYQECVGTHPFSALNAINIISVNPNSLKWGAGLASVCAGALPGCGFCRPDAARAVRAARAPRKIIKYSQWLYSFVCIHTQFAYVLFVCT